MVGLGLRGRASQLPASFYFKSYTESGVVIGKILSPMVDICQIIDDLGIKEEIIREQLQILFNSILKVKKKNLWFYVEGNEYYRIDEVERTFTYELYRLWKNRLRGFPYTINAEIQKCISDSINDLLSNNVKKSKLRYPDFVLHKNQSDFKIENQLLICEVKRNNTYGGIKKDFQTFKELMDSEHFSAPYAYAVFIHVCHDEKSILNQIRKNVSIFKGGKYSHKLISSEIDILDRIIYVSYDPRISKSPLKAKTIAQLLKMS